MKTRNRCVTHQCDLTGASVWHLTNTESAFDPDNKEIRRTLSPSCFRYASKPGRRPFFINLIWLAEERLVGQSCRLLAHSCLRCDRMFVGVCAPFTCPVFCWRIRGWLVAGVRCRRAEPLGGRVLLFAVAQHLGGACHLRTHLRAGSLHHVLQERGVNQK